MQSFSLSTQVTRSHQQLDESQTTLQDILFSVVWWNSLTFASHFPVFLALALTKISPLRQWQMCLDSVMKALNLKPQIKKNITLLKLSEVVEITVAVWEQTSDCGFHLKNVIKKV